MYIYHSPHTESPRVTVVGEFIGNFLYVAVAMCSKKDRFSRKIGRTIAMGRLKKRIYRDVIDIPHYPFFNSKIYNSKDFYLIAEMIATDVRETKKIVK